MTYYYWNSAKMAKDMANKPAAKAAGDLGYGICVDGQNKCQQYTMITQQSYDDKQRAGGYPDLHIIASGRDRDDVQVLVSPVGNVNTKLAQKLGFDTHLPKEELMQKIIAKTENFVDPAPQAKATKSAPKPDQKPSLKPMG